MCVQPTSKYSFEYTARHDQHYITGSVGFLLWSRNSGIAADLNPKVESTAYDERGLC